MTRDGAVSDWSELRQAMVEQQLRGRGIRHAGVLEAMSRVPRHEFVPESLQRLAYEDQPLPIGEDQTISQPYIVAYMCEAIDPQPGMRVLEVGTGSGYEAAILAEMVDVVYGIELLPNLARNAHATLTALGYRNIHIRVGDGSLGWPEAAPFDAIVVACGADQVPQPLIDQLKPGGRLVLPVGPHGVNQTLCIISKNDDGTIDMRETFPVLFVPLRHRA